MVHMLIFFNNINLKNSKIVLIMIYSYLANRFPGLKSKLRQAGIYQEPEDYIKSIVATSFLLSIGLSIFFDEDIYNSASCIAFANI